MKIDKYRFETAMIRLRELVKPGDTVHCVLRSVARSGMSRHIDLYRISDNQPFWLSGHASAVLGMRQAKDGSLVVSGSGMDMGFHLVYELGRAMWPDGFTCSGDNCQSNDHSNPGPERRDFSGKVWHSDGGYSLRKEWL
jgi:hypothetical protein